MIEGIPDQATAKEKFDLLYTKLKYYHDSSIDSVFKVAGFLIILAGWIITSKDTRIFLKDNYLIKLTAIFVILIVALTYTLIAVRVMRRSKQVFNMLKELGYMPATHFQDLLVSPSIIVPFVITNIFLSLALCLFILL
jgi:hypothetical protein